MIESLLTALFTLTFVLLVWLVLMIIRGGSDD